MSALPSWDLAALRALTIAGSLLPLGGWMLWGLACASGAGRPHLWNGLRRLSLIAAIVAFAAGVGWWIIVTARLAGMSWTPAQALLVLEETAFGHAWALRAAGLSVLIAVALTRSAPRYGRSAAAMVAALASTVSLSLAGHAAASGHAWRLACDLAHVLAAGLWLGALPLLVRALGEAGLAPSTRLRLTRRFSVLGVGCVTVLAFSGVGNASVLGWSSAWWTSDYGRLVLAKIGLFGAMLALAAYHRWRLTPRLASVDADNAARALRGSITAEFAIGGLILAVVGVLGATMPPMD